MDRVLLRTLTRKSKIGWGKFPEMTVQQIMDAGYKYELIKLYYTIQTITYTEDILEELAIFERYRIPKPGVDKEMLAKKQYMRLDKRTNGKARFIQKANEKKRAVRRCEKVEEEVNLSKAALQAINHGHRMAW